MKNQIRVPKTFSPSGVYCTCKSCAAKRFSNLVRVTGSFRASLFALCAVMDLPVLVKKQVKGKTPEEMFYSYLDGLDGGTGFASSTVNLFQWLKDAPDGAERIAEEEEHSSSLSPEKMREKWGGDVPETDWVELEKKYETESHEFKGNITPRIEKNLIALSKLDVDFDRAMANKDFDTANRITDIIKKTRDMESMRASDEKPAEEMRVDAIVDALERRGAMTDGTLCDRETLLKWIAESTHTHYNASLDIIDAVMLVSENARRRTEGEQMLTSVPKYMQVEDQYNELESHMTPQEVEIMKGLGAMPPSRDR